MFKGSLECRCNVDQRDSAAVRNFLALFSEVGLSYHGSPPGMEMSLARTAQKVGVLSDRQLGGQKYI